MAADRAGRIHAVGFDPAASSTEVVAACNVCGSDHLVEVSREDRYAYAVRFVVCHRCGLGFLAPRLTASAYAAFYADVYRPLVSAYHGRLIDATTVQAEQREYAEQLVGFLRAALVAPPAAIMDIGGSTGVVSGVVREALGGVVTVLDPAPDELAVAAAAGMEVVAGFAEDFDATGRRWDLVLLCQTIDHLLDLRATLSALRGMLADGGRAFIDVLDVGFMAQRRGSIEGAVKLDHPYYLTRDSAEALFAVTGLRVVAERLSHDGHWGFLLEHGEVREPDWAALAAARRRLLAQLWSLRAHG